MERCPGCHLELEPRHGPTDAFGGASAACFGLYGVVLAREFSHPAYFAAHQLSGHAYVAQHPSRRSRAAVQTLWINLVGLHLRLERGSSIETVGHVMAQLTASQPSYDWPEPPEERGSVRVVDLLAARDAAEHGAITRRWAESVWQAWQPHHAAVRQLAASVRTRRTGR